jgi:dihydrolipoamide dehydrogenase
MSNVYDIAVIGSGPGGYVAALKAAQMGAKTALIEKREVGGTCLNRGCIPTKAFLAAAELLHDIRCRAPEMGIVIPGEPTLKWETTLERKNKVLDAQRKGLHFLFEKRGIALIAGEGSLERPGRIAVKGKDGASTVEARNVILASGSRPSRVPGWPTDERVVTSDEALDWKALPKSLLIVGAGVVGCEFACLLAEFGVEVTLVEMLSQFVPGMDADLAKGLQRVFKKRKIAFHLDTKVEDLREHEGKMRATLSGGKVVDVEKVLVATGRRPESEALGLQNAGIASERGFVMVNNRMETNVANHYAIGDLNGRALLAHAASAQGLVAVKNALGGKEEVTATVPWCVYTFPEVAGVGMREDQARDKGLPIASGTFPMTALGKARAYGDTEGFVKVVRNRETQEILGVHAMGHAATEFIAAAGVLVHTKAKATDVTNMIFAHPTMSEAVREAAETALFEALHLPPAKTVRITM